MGQPKSNIIRTSCVDLSVTPDPGEELIKMLGKHAYAFVIIMASPSCDLTKLSKQLTENIDAEHIIGTRTAGEICSLGYCTNHVVALGFPRSHFTASVRVFEELSTLDDNLTPKDVLRLRHETRTKNPRFENEFAFLLVDGLSRREDALVLKISSVLGSTQLFGGSSGDGLRFENAPVFWQDKLYNNAALLLVVRSNCRFEVFREDHFASTQNKLVVTGADPEQRLVTEINAEPAAPEYARIVGIDPNQLSPFIFASHPLVVSLGNQHHVRAIQRVEGNDLRFFSAIDEGMVLTVAHANNITSHLQSVLDRLSEKEEPDLIFACDCILRRLEAEQKQEARNMSNLLSEHRVLGFSTYGEQHNMLHVNQTLTGIAIYAPS